MPRSAFMVSAAYPTLTRSRIQITNRMTTNGMMCHQTFRSSAASSISPPGN